MKLPINRYFEPLLEARPSGGWGWAFDVAIGLGWALLLVAVILASRSGEVPFIYGQF